MRRLPILVLIAALASAPAARAGFLLESADETITNGIARYTYSLAAPEAFALGETLTISGVDPTAIVRTAFPSFFRVTDEDGVVSLVAIQPGISGTLPVLEIDSLVTIGSLLYAVDRASGEFNLVVAPGPKNAVFATPEPGSLGMLAGGLALAAAWRRGPGRVKR